MASTGMIVIMGIALFFNLFALKWKIENERYGDATLDATVLVLLGWIFGGSVSGLAIATVASAVMSLYLIISPPDLSMFDE